MRYSLALLYAPALGFAGLSTTAPECLLVPYMPLALLTLAIQKAIDSARVWSALKYNSSSFGASRPLSFANWAPQATISFFFSVAMPSTPARRARRPTRRRPESPASMAWRWGRAHRTPSPRSSRSTPLEQRRWGLSATPSRIKFQTPQAHRQRAHEREHIVRRSRRPF